MTDSSGTSMPWCTCCRYLRPTLIDSGTKAMLPRKLASGQEVTWKVASGTRLQANHSELANDPLADFIVACVRPTTVDALAVEFKSKVGNVQHIVKQLENALKLVPASYADHLTAVLGYSGRMDAMVIKQLRTKRVNVRGQQVPIKRIKSGDSLERALAG